MKKHLENPQTETTNFGQTTDESITLKPWAMRFFNDEIMFFDTHDEMIAHSILPDVIYRTMGRTEYIIEC